MCKFFKDKKVFTSDVFKLDKKFIPGIEHHFLLNKGELKGHQFDVIIMRRI